MNSLSFSFFLFLFFLPQLYGYPMPDNVNCTKVQWCDTENNVCATVCKRGTLVIDPWLKYATKTQRNLAFTLPFCYAQLPGAHNSAITLAEGYGVDDSIWSEIIKVMDFVDPIALVRTNDQYFSLTDLFNLGLRMVELDTHWIENRLTIAHCGGVHLPIVDEFFAELNKIAEYLGYNVTWDTETVGCYPSFSSIPADMQRSLESAFQEIQDWMNLPENKNEFLMFFFDDQDDLEEWGVVPQLIGLINKYFGSTVFTPVDKQKYAPTWNISINEIIGLGKRVLFLSGSDFGAEMNSTIFAKYGPDLCNWDEPDYDNFKPFPVCEISGDQINAGRILRMPTSELMYGPFNGGFNFGPNTGVLTPENLPPLVQCNFNYPSPDLLDHDKMAAQIWTWSLGEPVQGKNRCTILDQLTGRWRSLDCSLGVYAACRKQENLKDWVLTSTPAPFSKVVCPSGYIFAPPTDPYQNSIVVSLLKSTSQDFCWLNYTI